MDQARLTGDDPCLRSRQRIVCDLLFLVYYTCWLTSLSRTIGQFHLNPQVCQYVHAISLANGCSGRYLTFSEPRYLRLTKGIHYERRTSDTGNRFINLRRDCRRSGAVTMSIRQCRWKSRPLQWQLILVLFFIMFKSTTIYMVHRANSLIRMVTLYAGGHKL